MIYIVLKIISGEEVIGYIDLDNEDDIPNLEFFEVGNPMWIVSDEDGSMKLRDATILAQNKGLIFYTENVITCYKPSEPLVEYYRAASEYALQCTQPEINKQILHAKEEVEQMMKDAKEFESGLTKYILKASKTSIH
jgi:hypothetical protein